MSRNKTIVDLPGISTCRATYPAQLATRYDLSEYDGSVHEFPLKCKEMHT